MTDFSEAALMKKKFKIKKGLKGLFFIIRKYNFYNSNFENFNKNVKINEKGEKND